MDQTMQSTLIRQGSSVRELFPAITAVVSSMTPAGSSCTSNLMFGDTTAPVLILPLSVIRITSPTASVFAGIVAVDVKAVRVVVLVIVFPAGMLVFEKISSKSVSAPGKLCQVGRA